MTDGDNEGPGTGSPPRKPAPFAPSILIVDDDAEVRTVVRRALEDVGYFVHETASAREALRLIRRRHLDLAIVDLSMPEMDGLELLQELRSLLPYLKILVVSSFMKGAMLNVAAKLGATATMRKGRSQEEMVVTVCKLLEGH